MKTHKSAIKEIIRFKSAFDKINPKIARKLVGELGEYYALCELEKRNLLCIPKGGQSGYDIYIPSISKRIEVRTSLLKNEGLYPKEVKFFGWRIKNRHQKYNKKFDYIICIALDESFKKPKFYIFNHKEAFSVGNVNIGRFQNVQKKIHLFQNINSMKNAIKAKPGYVTKYEIYINNNSKAFMNKWSKIK